MTDPNDNPSEELPGDEQDASSPNGIEVQFDGDEDFEEDEFTLETLSEAYAEVVDQRSEHANEDEKDAAQSASKGRPSGGNDDDPSSAPAPNAKIVDDDAACPISPESIVESILLVGSPKDVKLTGKKIASVLRDVSPKEVAQIIKQLNEGYEKRDAAFRVHADRGVYRMVLDPSLGDFQNEYFGRNRQARLPQSAIDVMAVVAYHQPVAREEVDRIRGKSSSSVLNQLVKRRLLDVEKSTDRPARKFYKTTDRFLDLFGLEDLDDLPESHDMADIEELAD